MLAKPEEPGVYLRPRSHNLLLRRAMHLSSFLTNGSSGGLAVEEEHSMEILVTEAYLISYNVSLPKNSVPVRSSLDTERLESSF